MLADGGFDSPAPILCAGTSTITGHKNLQKQGTNVSPMDWVTPKSLPPCHGEPASGKELEVGINDFERTC